MDFLINVCLTSVWNSFRRSHYDNCENLVWPLVSHTSHKTFIQQGILLQTQNNLPHSTITIMGKDILHPSIDETIERVECALDSSNRPAGHDGDNDSTPQQTAQQQHQNQPNTTSVDNLFLVNKDCCSRLEPGTARCQTIPINIKPSFMSWREREFEQAPPQQG